MLQIKTILTHIIMTHKPIDLEVTKWGEQQIYYVKTILTKRVHNYKTNTDEWIRSTELELFTSADSALKWFYSRVDLITKEERAVRSEMYSDICEREDENYDNRLYAYFSYTPNKYKKYSVILDAKNVQTDDFKCDSLFYGYESCALSRIGFDNEYSSQDGDRENYENGSWKNDEEQEENFINLTWAH